MQEEQKQSKLCSKCRYNLKLLRKKACYCHFILSDKISSKHQFIILQHPSEKKQKNNSIQILENNFSSLYKHIGRKFSDTVIPSLTHNIVLLYPAPSAKLVSQFDFNQSHTVVVIDATWKYAKEIYASNSFLQQIPAVKLNVGEDAFGTFVIRKPPSANCFSTYEAVALFLKETGQQDKATMLMEVLKKVTSFRLSFIKEPKHNPEKKSYIQGLYGSEK